MDEKRGRDLRPRCPVCWNAISEEDPHVVCAINRGEDRTREYEAKRQCILCAKHRDVVMSDHACYDCDRMICSKCCDKGQNVQNLFRLVARRCPHCCRRENSLDKSTCGHYRLSSPAGQVCEECKQCISCVYKEDLEPFHVCSLGTLCVLCHKKKHTTCEQCGRSNMGSVCYSNCQHCQQRVCDSCRFRDKCVKCRLGDRTGGRCGICEKSYDATTAGRCAWCRRREDTMEVKCELCPETFSLCCLHKSQFNCTLCKGPRCANHSISCASCCLPLAACSVCISGDDAPQGQSSIIRRDLAIQCDKCKKTTRDILDDSDLPRDLQHSLYSYLFDDFASAKKTHLESIIEGMQEDESIDE